MKAAARARSQRGLRSPNQTDLCALLASEQPFQTCSKVVLPTSQTGHPSYDLSKVSRTSQLDQSTSQAVARTKGFQVLISQRVR